jgi:hypothetical protein
MRSLKLLGGREIKKKKRAMYEQAWLALHSLFLLEDEAAASRE